MVENEDQNVTDTILGYAKSSFESFVNGCLKASKIINSYSPDLIIIPLMGGYVPFKIMEEIGDVNRKKYKVVFIPASSSIDKEFEPYIRELILQKISSHIRENENFRKMIIIDEAKSGASVYRTYKKIESTVRHAFLEGKIKRKLDLKAVVIRTSKGNITNSYYKTYVNKGKFKEVLVEDVISMDNEKITPIQYVPHKTYVTKEGEEHITNKPKIKLASLEIRKNFREFMKEVKTYVLNKNK